MQSSQNAITQSIAAVLGAPHLEKIGIWPAELDDLGFGKLLIPGEASCILERLHCFAVFNGKAPMTEAKPREPARHARANAVSTGRNAQSASGGGVSWC